MLIFAGLDLRALRLFYRTGPHKVRGHILRSVVFGSGYFPRLTFLQLGSQTLLRMQQNALNFTVIHHCMFGFRYFLSYVCLLMCLFYFIFCLHEINSMQLEPVEWLSYNIEYVSLLSVTPFSIKVKFCCVIS